MKAPLTHERYNHPMNYFQRQKRAAERNRRAIVQRCKHAIELVRTERQFERARQHLASVIMHRIPAAIPRALQKMELADYYWLAARRRASNAEANGYGR